MTNGKDWEERENKRGLYHSRSRRIRRVYIRMKTNVSKAEDPSTALDVVHLYHSHPLISEGKNFTLLISDLTAGTNCYLTYIPSNHVPSACMGHSYEIVFVCTSLPKTADKRQVCFSRVDAFSHPLSFTRVRWGVIVLIVSITKHISLDCLHACINALADKPICQFAEILEECAVSIQTDRA